MNGRNKLTDENTLVRLGVLLNEQCCVVQISLLYWAGLTGIKLVTSWNCAVLFIAMTSCIVMKYTFYYIEDMYLVCDMRSSEGSSYCNWLVICSFAPKKGSPTKLTE